MPPLIAYQMPNCSYPGAGPDGLFDRVVALARAVESAGFDAVTVMEPLLPDRRVGPESEPMLEAYTTLGASPRPPGRPG